MHFTFWLTLPNGSRQDLVTDNLFQAKRLARERSAAKLFVHNPLNQVVSQLAF